MGRHEAATRQTAIDGGDKEALKAGAAAHASSENKGGYADWDRDASIYYKTKDDTTGMALREECEAFARRCEQERKDCEKHVAAFHDPDKMSGGQSKMHAINTSASCLTRSQTMTKEAKALQAAAVQRVLDLKASGASDDKISRADATAVVVRDAVSACVFETQGANRAFKTTSALNRK